MTNPTTPSTLTVQTCAEEVKELLLNGETFKARHKAMQAIEFFGEENIDAANMQILAMPHLFDSRFETDETIRQRFAHLWAPSWDTYNKGFDQREYLGRLLWVTELLIRNGLGSVAFWLLQSEIGMLWQLMRAATRQLLEKYRAFPGFESFYQRIQPMLRTPGPSAA